MVSGFESRMNLSALKWETSAVKRQRLRREKRKEEAFINRGCRWARQAYKLARNEREIITSKYELDDRFVSLQQKFCMDQEYRGVKISHDIRDLADQAFGDFSHIENLQYLYPTTIPTAFRAIFSRNEKVRQNSSTVYKLLVQLIEKARQTKEMCLMRTKQGRRIIKQHPGLRLVNALIPEPQKDLQPEKEQDEDIGDFFECTCMFHNFVPQLLRPCDECPACSQEKCDSYCRENWQCDNDLTQSRMLPSVSELTDSKAHVARGKVRWMELSDDSSANPSISVIVQSQDPYASLRAAAYNRGQAAKRFGEAQFEKEMTSGSSESHTDKIGGGGILEWAETKAFPRGLYMTKYPDWERLGKSAPSPLTSWEVEGSEMGRGGPSDMESTNKKQQSEKVITEEEMLNFLLDNLENKVRQEMDALKQGRTGASKWTKSKKGRPFSATKTRRPPTSAPTSDTTSTDETGEDLLTLLLNAFFDAVSLTLEKVQSTPHKSCNDVCDLLQAALRLASDQEFFTSILESLALVSRNKTPRGGYKSKKEQRNVERRLRKKPRIFNVQSLMDILSQYSERDTKSVTCSSGSVQYVNSDQNAHSDGRCPDCQSCSPDSDYYVPSKGLRYEYKRLPVQLPIIDDLQDISDGSDMFKHKRKSGVDTSKAGSLLSETTNSEKNTNTSKRTGSTFSGTTASPIGEKKCKGHTPSSDPLDSSLSEATYCQRLEKKHSPNSIYRCKGSSSTESPKDEKKYQSNSYGTKPMGDLFFSSTDLQQQENTYVASTANSGILSSVLSEATSSQQIENKDRSSAGISKTLVSSLSGATGSELHLLKRGSDASSIKIFSSTFSETKSSHRGERSCKTGTNSSKTLATSISDTTDSHQYEKQHGSGTNSSRTLAASVSDTPSSQQRGEKSESNASHSKVLVCCFSDTTDSQQGEKKFGSGANSNKTLATSSSEIVDLQQQEKKFGSSTSSSQTVIRHLSDTVDVRHSLTETDTAYQPEKKPESNTSKTRLLFSSYSDTTGLRQPDRTYKSSAPSSKTVIPSFSESTCSQHPGNNAK